MKEKLKLEVQVTKVKSDKSPDLKALASVQFGGFKINNIKVVEREVLLHGVGLRPRDKVLFPKNKVMNRDGEIEYKDIVTFGINEEQGKQIRKTISSMIIQALEQEERTTKISKETDFEIDKDFVNVYINSTPNSEKILGVGAVYYGGLVNIKPVYLKEVKNVETNEKFNVISFETRVDKNGNYKEIVYPNQEGLRRKCVDEAIKSLKKDKEQINAKEESYDLKESNEEDLEI